MAATTIQLRTTGRSWWRGRVVLLIIMVSHIWLVKEQLTLAPLGSYDLGESFWDKHSFKRSASVVESALKQVLSKYNLIHAQVEQFPLSNYIKYTSSIATFIEYTVVLRTDSNDIYRLKWVQLYNAANDPQIGPQMIPNCKWSLMWTANDPGGKRGMAWSLLIRSRFLFFYHKQKQVITNHILHGFTELPGQKVLRINTVKALRNAL